MSMDDATPVATTDRQRREALLRAYYRKRFASYAVLLPSDIDGADAPLFRAAAEIDRISLQLIELGYLRTRRLDRLLEKSESIEGRLTARGVDVVEQPEPNAVAPLAQPQALTEARQRWYQDWPVALAGFAASCIYASAVNLIGHWYGNKAIDWQKAAETAGNCLLLLGIIYTAVGTRLSPRDTKYFKAAQETREPLESGRVAAALLSASHYAKVALFWLVCGTLIALLAIIFRKPEQKTDEETRAPASDKEHSPVLFQNFEQLCVPISFQADFPAAACPVDSKAKSTAAVKRAHPGNVERNPADSK